MHPILVSTGSATIASYPFMLSLAFLAGGALFIIRGTKSGAPATRLAGLVVLVQVTGLLGARALFLLNTGANDAANALALSPGGFAVNGGIIVAAVASWLYLSVSRLPGWSVGDWAAASLGLGIFLTKIGCFMGGCCFGTPTAVPWAVEFPPGSLAATALGTPNLVHPAQLYEAFAGLMLMVVALAWRPHGAVAGQRLLLVVALYLAVRFLNDYVRGDSRDGFLGPLTQTQALSLFMGAVAVGAFWVRRREGRGVPGEDGRARIAGPA